MRSLRHPFTIGVALLSSAVIPAQQAHIPSTYAQKDGPSWGNIAGLASHRRQEVIVHRDRLKGIVQKELRSLWFRRDSRVKEALLPGLSDLSVTLSTGGVAPERASPAFDKNHGTNRIKVFAGRVIVPRSPRLNPNQTADWGSNNTVRIPFTTPFRYSGGHLCIEILGKPFPQQGTDFWPVDFDYDQEKGTASEFGASCFPFAGGRLDSTSASEASLRVGGTARIHAFGRPSTPGILFLGTELFPNGLSLRVIGAPGCTAYLKPLISSGHMFLPLPKLPYGFTNAAIFVPNNRSFAGGTFFAQWANLETRPPRTNAAGLTTSNALRLTLASKPPTLKMALVSSGVIQKGGATPTTGVVYQFKAPVLRLGF